MYSTSIGIVIESIARMQLDSKLHASQEAEKAKAHVVAVQEVTIEDAANEEEMDSKDKKGGKTKKKIDLKEIITSFSNIFTTDDIK